MTGDGAGPRSGAGAVRRGPTTGVTRHVVVMGVSGSGKSTVARGIADATGLCFAEADEFHSPVSVAKMRAGLPLNDADRWPWLRALAAWMAARSAEGVSTVLACSALKRSYRDVLRGGPPGIDIVQLRGDRGLIRRRVALRTGHYMPASLLESQIATLEPPGPDEHAIVLDVRRTPDELVAAAVARLDLPRVLPQRPLPHAGKIR